MKLLLPGFTAATFLACAPFAAGSLLVGFYDFGDTTSDSASVTNGFSGSVTAGISSEDIGGSNDNLYGDSSIQVSPAATQDGHSKVQAGEDLVFSMTNQTGNTVALASFLFDAAYKELATNVLSYAWTTTGGDSGSDSVSPSHQQTVWDGPGDYADYSVDLTGVSLADNEVITFTFSTLAGGGETFRLDNVALTAIPETAGVFALASLCLSGAFFRQRRSLVAAPAAA